MNFKVVDGIMEYNLTIDTKQDIVTSTMPLIKDIKPNWNNLDYKIPTDGITNKLIVWYEKVDEKSENAVIIKIYGEKSDRIINRKMEINYKKYIHAKKFDKYSKIFAIFTNGYAYEYCPGECVSLAESKSPEINELIAKNMARMHSQISIEFFNSPKIVPTSQLPIFKRISSLLNHLKDVWIVVWSTNWVLQIVFLLFTENGARDKKHLRPLILEDDIIILKKVRNEFSHLELKMQGEWPVVMCHNDILLNNIVISPERDSASFIDYEYAFPNVFIFDIANYFNELCGIENIDYSLYPSREFMVDWIKCYIKHRKIFDSNSRDNLDLNFVINYLKHYTMLSHLFWMVWAMVQSTISEISFDYHKYALERYNQFLLYLFENSQ
ncbi:hypothetical protein A3Q56_00561 [Intoshia linei]|uniref:ethanolamine kinase n=1 Tax=Intoshia linei TaxID=1819745 RepID=A0A177BDQ3_9BILA|nr:hypothetical protein A3Q56_00561 [Intoshia linei]